MGVAVGVVVGVGLGVGVGVGVGVGAGAGFGVGVGVAVDLFNRGLCLPSETARTESDLDRIISVVRGCHK